MLGKVDDKTLITITPEWMEKKFNEMNELLFDGALKPCRLELFTKGRGSQGGTLGWFNFGNQIYSDHKRRTLRGKRPGYVMNAYGDKVWLDGDNFNNLIDPVIQLNGNYNWTEKAALSTLVHEMVHYYDFKDGWVPMQAHGPNFRRIAAWVSAKSDQFFTVERLAKAEQMEQMDFTESMKEKHSELAAKGIHFFKFELAEPETSKRGRTYKYAYAIPASTILDKYVSYVKSMPTDRYKRVVHCVTTDGNIKRYHTVKSVGRWFYTTGDTFDDIMSDVKVDQQEEVQREANARLEKPWYIFRMKCKTPYKRGKTVYPWGYYVVEAKNFFKVYNYLLNSQKEFTYADYTETHDPKVQSHRPNGIKSLDCWYISEKRDVLETIEQGEPTVIFGKYPKAM